MTEINDLVDIVSLISYSNVDLHKTGDVFFGLCPLHKDKNTPSLVVYPATNSWCCFGTGCGGKAGKLNGGRAVDWVMQRYTLDFAQAVSWIEENYLHIPKIDLPKFGEKKSGVSKPLMGIEPVVYWHGLLDTHNRREWFHKRGFSDETIDRELFGWNESRYVIPVWEGEPGNSLCLGVRLRRSEIGNGPKYIGLEGHNQPTVWGRWHCRSANLIFAFAGELDAARAVQDGLPAFSVVNGVKSVTRFPKNWPEMWFPDAKYMIVVFDKGEELDAAVLARHWNSVKGSLTARVFHWPPDTDYKDYCEFRDDWNTRSDFLNLVDIQITAPYK